MQRSIMDKILEDKNRASQQRQSQDINYIHARAVVAANNLEYAKIIIYDRSSGRHANPEFSDWKLMLSTGHPFGLRMFYSSNKCARHVKLLT